MNYFLYLHSFGISESYIQALFLTLTVIALVFTVLILVIRGLKKTYEFRRRIIEKRARERINKILFMYPELVDPNTRDNPINKSKLDYIITKINTTLKFNRNIIADQILDLHYSFSGEYANKLGYLFNFMSLDKDIKDDLAARSWVKKSKAIIKVGELHLARFDRQIQELVDDDNELVRRNARVALIKLNGPKALNFIPHLTIPISLFEQILIFEIIRKWPFSEIPDFVEIYKASTELSVKLFCIKCIGFTNQISGTELLKYIISTGEAELGQEATQALLRISPSEGQKYMMNGYHTLKSIDTLVANTN